MKRPRIKEKEAGVGLFYKKVHQFSLIGRSNTDEFKGFLRAVYHIGTCHKGKDFLLGSWECNTLTMTANSTTQPMDSVVHVINHLGT